MTKIPHKPEDIFEPFTDDYRAAFGADLESIILYGSAARSEYVPKVSDINFLIMLSPEGMQRLAAAMPLVDRWGKARVATPLFLTQDYIFSSIDVFPIEFLNMKASYRLVWGKDVLKNLEFDKRLVRLQAEREIKAKLLHLRERFVETGGSAKKITQLISISLPAFFSIFQAVLFLNDQQPSTKMSELLALASRSSGLNASLFETLAAVRNKTRKLKPDESLSLMDSYLEEVHRLAMHIDSFIHR
jgi:predicted nucleotidyltransferase